MTGMNVILILLGLSWTGSTKNQEVCSRSVMNYPHSWSVYGIKATNVTVCQFSIERTLRYCDEFNNLNSAAYCQRAFQNYAKKMDINFRWTHYSDDRATYCTANGAAGKTIASLKNFSAEVNLIDDVIKLENVFANYSMGYFKLNDGDIFVWETGDPGDFWKGNFSCNSLEVIGTVNFVGYISNQRNTYRILEYENDNFVAQLNEKPNITCKGRNPTIWHLNHHPIAFIESGYNINNKKHPLPSKFEDFFIQQTAVYNEILGKCNFPDAKKPEMNLTVVFCILGVILCYILIHFIVTLYNMFTNYTTFKNANYKGPVHLFQGQINEFYFYSIRDLMWRTKGRPNETKAYERIQHPENNYEYVSSEYDFNYLYNKNTWNLDK